MPCLPVKQTDDKKIKRPVPTHNSLPLNKEIAGSKRPILLKRKPSERKSREIDGELSNQMLLKFR